MELLEPPPLGTGADIAAYLDIKSGRLGKARSAVIDGSGCEAPAAKLRRETGNGAVYSAAYPLLISSWTRRAMDTAAEPGADAADADAVKAL